MREIKFRGKNTDGDWVFGYFVNSKRITAIIDNDDVEYEVDPQTVGQFTGFKDVDNTDIYKGDIVQNTEHPELIGKIINENSCWLVEPLYVFDKVCLVWLLDNTPQKVIGNVHDNPELLEVKDND